VRVRLDPRRPAVETFSRAAAELLAMPVNEIARQIAVRHGFELAA
jgi:hypothetical protein